jgi:hypothetical protein
VIAEIRLGLLAHFLDRGLTAMIRITRVIVDAELADMQLGVTRLADVETP